MNIYLLLIYDRFNNFQEKYARCHLKSILYTGIYTVESI
jgi:hypothetical protein